MEAADVLREARELIALGEMPVQRADAVDLHGRRCYPTEGHANRWSMTGALLKVGRDADGDVFLAALTALARAIDVVEPVNRLLCMRIWEWEDQPGRRIEHVLAAFARAEEGVTMASKRRRRRAAERPLPPLSDKTGMSSEALLAHRELEVIRAGFQGKRGKHLRKVALLREAADIAAKKTA